MFGIDDLALWGIAALVLALADCGGEDKPKLKGPLGENPDETKLPDGGRTLPRKCINNESADDNGIRQSSLVCFSKPGSPELCSKFAFDLPNLCTEAESCYQRHDTPVTDGGLPDAGITGTGSLRFQVPVRFASIPPERNPNGDEAVGLVALLTQRRLHDYNFLLRGALYPDCHMDFTIQHLLLKPDGSYMKNRDGTLVLDTDDSFPLFSPRGDGSICLPKKDYSNEIKQQVTGPICGTFPAYDPGAKVTLEAVHVRTGDACKDADAGTAAGNPGFTVRLIRQNLNREAPDGGPRD